ncbi:MAG: NUDIX domain-containing protein [Candidatus Microsaccharimonas sp.]
MSELLTTDTERTMKKLALPTPQETEAFIAAGYNIDKLGRPLHPDLDILPEEQQNNGRGGFWNYGPNYTADPIIITTEAQPKVLLITRKDGTLAFPGGFTEGEDPFEAARREAEEEAHYKAPNTRTLIYEGIVTDPRTSANAWAETSAFLFEVPGTSPVVGDDDAQDADWYDANNVPKEMYGSHAALLKMALEFRAKPRTIEAILAIPEAEREIDYIDAGHMAYRHYFTRHQDDRLFVKAHDSSRFTDPFREAHSRSYLEKEYTLFHNLQSQGYGFLPNRVGLVDDTLLAMDALHPEDGWYWRAPQEPAAFEHYVQDTLLALEVLQEATPPLHPEYHKDIKDTYLTLWEEGWDSISDESIEHIIAKIRQFSTKWSPEQYDASEGLIHSLPLLRQKALAINRKQPLFMAHNDARQSNIAWHPQQGTKLVDWSWGDVAPKNADATMFLIDLAKSGRSVSEHLETFNQEHAQILIGFWLAHSLWETRDGSSTVREHQVASAIAAYQLSNL